MTQASIRTRRWTFSRPVHVGIRPKCGAAIFMPVFKAARLPKSAAGRLVTRVIVRSRRGLGSLRKSYLSARGS